MEKRICTHCKEEKEFSGFFKDKKGKYGIGACCKICTHQKHIKYRQTHKKERNEYENNQNLISPLWRKKKAIRSAQYYTKLKETDSVVLIAIRERSKIFLRSLKKDNPAYFIWKAAKHRALVNNIPFNILLEDIVIPEYCPILEIKLFAGNGKTCDNSPSLDRLVPNLGYTKGNIKVISHLANAMKNSADFSLLEKFSNNIINYINNKDIVQTIEKDNL